MSVRSCKLIVLIICLSLAGSIRENLSSQPLSILADSLTYVWPTDATHQISSTFGETRSSHLHAGLDIRTWGQEGYKVFATRDGIIYRIGTGPYGYGNVLYMKHSDGSFSVYAHLNRFEPNLQAYTDSIRMENYTFSIDKIVEGDSLYYKKGDVIAFSGSSGIGPPHLHFELRDPQNKPFNPLLTNISVQDDLQPVFRQLGIEFLKPGTLKPERYEIVNARKSGNRYSFGEITVNQPVGLSVNVHDRANFTPNVYAVYTLSMVLESDTLFHSRIDQFSYREGRQMFLDRSYQILAQTRRGFQRLYRVNGNRIPIYTNLKNEGVLALNEGRYPLKIIASDVYGNRTEATVTLNVQGNNHINSIAYVPTYPEASIDKKPFAVHKNQILFDNQTLLLASSESVPFDIIKNQGSTRFSSNFSIEKKLVPDKQQVLNTPNQRLWIEFPKEAVYDTLNLHLDISRIANEIRFNFSPDRLPIDGHIYFNYILPDDLKDNERLGLYSVDKFRNRSYFMGASNKNGIIRSAMGEISSLVIREDNTPPWIGNPQFEKNLAGSYIILIPAGDRGTGIDYESSKIVVNGERGITGYNPDRGSLFYYVPGFNPARENNIEIEVYDRMGNRSSKTASLSFRN